LKKEDVLSAPCIAWSKFSFFTLHFCSDSYARRHCRSVVSLWPVWPRAI